MGFLAERAALRLRLEDPLLRQAGAAFWTADQAQIYRTLDRLQAARLVSCTRKRQVGRPDRKVYRLTAAGSQALAALAGLATRLSPPRDPFLLQVFFSAALGDDEIVESLRRRRRAPPDAPGGAAPRRRLARRGRHASRTAPGSCERPRSTAPSRTSARRSTGSTTPSRRSRPARLPAGRSPHRAETGCIGERGRHEQHTAPSRRQS